MDDCLALVRHASRSRLPRPEEESKGYDEAKDCLVGLLDEHPDDRQLMREVGVAVHGVEDHETTLDVYERALAAHPGWSLLHSDMSRYLATSIRLSATARTRELPSAVDYAVQASATIQGLEQLGAIARLEPGDVLADIGCGTGRYAFPFARWVGPEGTVWAVDIRPQYIEVAEQAARQLGLSWIQGHLARESDLRLPADSVDPAFMSRVWVSAGNSAHADAWLGTIASALAPDGRFLVTGEPVRSLEDLRSRLEPHGLVLDSKAHFDEEGDIWVFKAP